MIGVPGRIVEIFRGLVRDRAVPGEPYMIAEGWDDYAQKWAPGKFRVLPETPVQHLGDEWTGEDVTGGGTTYGLPRETLADFSAFLEQKFVSPYISGSGLAGMEIGPGGGRLTKLLLERSAVLHAVDGSNAMLAALKMRFANESRILYHHCDGSSLPSVGQDTLDYVTAFDVFVHFEPRLVYWYLGQIAKLLKPGGVGVIHYSNTLTPLGGKQFLADVGTNLCKREQYFAFGVMTPELMGRFIEFAGLQVVSTDTGVIPRDAVAVFRKPEGRTAGA